MVRTLAELADLVGGTVEGDGRTIVHGAAPHGLAGAHDITLIDSAERAQRDGAGQAVAAVAPQGVELGGLPLIRVADSHAAFARIVAAFRPPRKMPRTGISPQANVSPWARIAPDVDIHSGATVGDDVEIAAGVIIHSGVHILPGCRVGANTMLFPGVVLYENTIVGARCMIHAGVVLGAYGYGYRWDGQQHQRSAQLGHVEVGDDVEIGANSTIDRGTYGPTVIGSGTKIDNLVMIAHNCRIGRHNLICSQVGIAGSTTTGDHVIMAGQVGVRDHVHVGERAILGAKAGVHTDVEPGADMLGAPAIRTRDFWVQQANLGRLPDLRRTVRELKSQIEALTERLNEQQHPAAPKRRKAC